MNQPQPIHHVPRARHAFDATMHDGATIRIRQHGTVGLDHQDGIFPLVKSHSHISMIYGYET